MDKWPLGVFASIDAGLGVKLEVAHELGVPTIQLHAPHQATRTKQQAEQFLARLEGAGHPHHAWSSAASRARAMPTFPRSPARWAWCRRPRVPRGCRK